MFLPTTLDELGGEPPDVLLVTGDAYVDHPAWGVAAIGRWLEAHGFRVGVLAQPDWEDPAAWTVLGRPRLFVGISAGNMDSMVNRYTASRRLRSTDAYSPGGAVGLRPDRATIAYTSRARQAFPGLPVVVGGIEASLRRFAHFDFWQDRIRRSVLADAKADLLVFGMGERPVVEIARRLGAGAGVHDCRDIRGVCWMTGAKDRAPEGVALPSFEACREDPAAFARATMVVHREASPHCGAPLLQAHGDRVVVANPPPLPLSTADLDRLHELPYAWAPHPCYRAPVPAFEPVRASITVNRGCAGGCSFCALTVHQGKDVVSRSPESVLREVRAMAARPGFDGVVTDLGGPTANMFHMACTSPEANAVCRRPSCLHPVRCKHYGTDHGPYLSLMRAARAVPGVRRVYVNSGIRYDLAALDGAFVEELAAFHVQGQLSVAPEHAAPAVLARMRKPEFPVFEEFAARFADASEKAGRQQFLVPYFQCAHPGAGPAEAIELALAMKARGLRPRQAQMFVPTPGTLATAMYVAGVDPYGGKPVVVARGDRERSRQRALLFYWKREEWPHVREALLAWGRADLIGRGTGCLVPPGPAWGAWQDRSADARFDTHMGMRVERASAEEEAADRWEAVGGQSKR